MESNKEAVFNLNQKIIPAIKDEKSKAPSANSIVVQNGKNTISLVDGAEITSMVSLTVSHLQDLAKQFQNVQKQWNGTEDTTDIIDTVIKTLHQLDLERLQLHEALEAETITASAHRHKLGPFAEQIEEEIRDAVNAARQSNEAEVDNLKGKINELLIESDALEQRHKLLTVESCGLEPEKNRLKIHDDKMVALLNQTLTDRANMQIKLNDSRDHLRDTYQKISDIQQALIDVRKEMIEDKEEAQATKERLKKSVFETRKRVAEQANSNLLKSQEIKTLQLELNEKESQLDNEKKNIRQLEASRTHLEAKHAQLTRQMRKEVKETATLTQEGMKILEAGAGSSQILIDTLKQLNETRSAIESEMIKAAEDFKRLTEEKAELTNKLEIARASGTKETDEAKSINQKLRSAKDDLLFNTAECSRLTSENIDLERTIDQLYQDHQATVELLNKQIADFSVMLAAERRERHLLQVKRDGVTKEINDFKNEYGKLMAGVTKKITDGKTEHHKLSDYGLMLQKSLKQDEIDIKNKQKDLNTTKGKFEAMSKSYQDAIKNLEESITSLESEIEEKSDLIKTRMPTFEELEKNFKRKTTDFDEMKKYIVDLKNKKGRIETSIIASSNKISKMQNPQVLIRNELAQDRRNFLEILRKQTDEVKEKEREIFLASHRFNLVNKENERMAKAIREMTDDIDIMKKRREDLQAGRINVEHDIHQYKDWLDQKWSEDVHLDSEYCKRDLPFIDDLKQIQEVASKREEMVDEVHGKLEEQLSILAHFIDNVAGFRPK